MSRTYKDLPYKVARERFGVREPFLIMGHAERRTHGADVIFYAHEVDAIATFEEHLAKDSRFAFAGGYRSRWALDYWSPQLLLDFSTTN